MRLVPEYMATYACTTYVKQCLITRRKSQKTHTFSTHGQGGPGNLESLSISRIDMVKLDSKTEPTGASLSGSLPAIDEFTSIKRTISSSSLDTLECRLLSNAGAILKKNVSSKGKCSINTLNTPYGKLDRDGINACFSQIKDEIERESGKLLLQARMEIQQFAGDIMSRIYNTVADTLDCQGERLAVSTCNDRSGASAIDT